jgi:hypothetical protein
MSLEFIQLQSYTAPSIIEQKNKDWVQYGDDNNYYQYLIDLYHSSPTNNACIKGTVDQIFGKGLEVTRHHGIWRDTLNSKRCFPTIVSVPLRWI